MINKKIINKNYGSIPHLSISKLTQQADKKLQIGKELILTKKARDWKDTIIVTEKLDGSNVGVIKKNCELIALTRKGYAAISSPYKQHHYFAKWVEKNKAKFEWLPEGFRICGEWMLLAHGTKYDINKESPFVVFDIIDSKNKRLCFVSVIETCAKYGLQHVSIIHVGHPISIKNALKLLNDGDYGHPEKPEGLVYKCEREGKVDFLAKYVREDKEDGKYLHNKEI